MKFLEVKMVLFDLDGTLVDTIPDLSLGVDGMMSELGLNSPGIDKVRRWVGNGVEKLVKRALTGGSEIEPDNLLYEKALPIFRRKYSENNGLFSQVYPGVKQTLCWLKDKKIPLACVTNKAELFAVPLLKSLEIYELFGIVISGDTLKEKKPSPIPLLHAANHFGIEPVNCLMVGDSINDVRAARTAGFRVVAVSYGYNHGQNIRDAAPDAVIDNFNELPRLLTF